jgi:hypothetical protein
MAAPLPVLPALDSTLGAIQIGIVLSICLYGAMCVQGFNYYQAEFQNEYLYVRVLVRSTISLKFWRCNQIFFEIGCLVLVSISIQLKPQTQTNCLTASLKESSRPSTPPSSPTISTSQPLRISVTTLICPRPHGPCLSLLRYPPSSAHQFRYTFLLTLRRYMSMLTTNGTSSFKIYFASRIYAVSKSWYLPAASTLASLMRVSLSVACSVFAVQSPTLAVLEQKYIYLVAWAVGISGIVDIANTIGLCYYLLKSRSEMPR